LWLLCEPGLFELHLLEEVSGEILLDAKVVTDLLWVFAFNSGEREQRRATERERERERERAERELR
jgi:hypothetical protein